MTWCFWAYMMCVLTEFILQICTVPYSGPLLCFDTIYISIWQPVNWQKSPDQTAETCRVIWAWAVHICHEDTFSLDILLIYSACIQPVFFFTNQIARFHFILILTTNYIKLLRMRLHLYEFSHIIYIKQKKIISPKNAVQSTGSVMQFLVNFGNLI